MPCRITQSVLLRVEGYNVLSDGISITEIPTNGTAQQERCLRALNYQVVCEVPKKLLRFRWLRQLKLPQQIISHLTNRPTECLSN